MVLDRNFCSFRMAILAHHMLRLPPQPGHLRLGTFSPAETKEQGDGGNKGGDSFHRRIKQSYARLQVL